MFGLSTDVVGGECSRMATDILLKFSSIVFVKYHVCFLFAEHFDQIELMFVQRLGGGREEEV